MRGSTKMAEDYHVILESDGEKPGFIRKCHSLCDITNRYENYSMEKHERRKNENMEFFLRKCNQLGKMQHEPYENAESEAEEAVVLSQSSSCRGENSHKRKDAGCIHSDSENIPGTAKPPTHNNGKCWYSMGAKRLHHSLKLDKVSTSLNATDGTLSDDTVSHISLLTNHDSFPSVHCKSRFSSMLGENDLEDVQRDHNDILKEQPDHSCDDNSQFIGAQVNGVEDNASLTWVDETSGNGGRLSSLADSMQQTAEEHTDLNGDIGFDQSSGIDLNKSCSCSFCLKAAYMWSDLYYQDARGRLTALKRSRKQVKSLEGRFYDHGDLHVNKHNRNSISNGRECSSKLVGLESNLIHHWRSLFLYAEDALVNESSQLQSSIYKLKELKRNCKLDLERMYGVSSEKP